MKGIPFNILLIILSLSLFAAPAHLGLCAEGPRRQWDNPARSYGPSFSVQPPTSPDSADMDTAIIVPFQKAVIGAEAPGVIKAMRFEEGDFVKKGQVVVEISKGRYQALAERAQGRLKAAQRALKRARDHMAIKGRLLEKGAITHQEYMRAKSETQMALAEEEEASQALKLARIDLRACVVRAPFTGYINQLFKNRYEPVGRLEELFELVDTSKVYAVAHIPGDRVGDFRKESKAIFRPTSHAKPRPGVIHKLGKSLDPSSGTKKVYLLMDNKQGALEIGMSGSLQLLK